MLPWIALATEDPFVNYLLCLLLARNQKSCTKLERLLADHHWKCLLHVWILFNCSRSNCSVNLIPQREVLQARGHLLDNNAPHKLYLQVNVFLGKIKQRHQVKGRVDHLECFGGIKILLDLESYAVWNVDFQFISLWLAVYCRVWLNCENMDCCFQVGLVLNLLLRAYVSLIWLSSVVFVSFGRIDKTTYARIRFKPALLVAGAKTTFCGFTPCHKVLIW